MSIGNNIKNKKLSSMPIPVGQPIEISVDQNTGELVISFYQLLSNDQTLQMSLVLEPAAALQLLSSSHEIEFKCCHILFFTRIKLCQRFWWTPKDEI